MPKVGPKTDVDAEVEAVTKVDDGLSKLYEAYQLKEVANQQKLVSIIEYVKVQKLSRAVVKATLEARGLTKSSVSSEVSRIMTLTRDENEPILEALQRGEMGIAAARKAVATPREKSQKSATDKLWEMLYRAARFAYKESATNTDFTLKYFSSEAANAWNQVKDEYEQKEREAQEAAEREAQGAEAEEGAELAGVE